MSEKSLKSLTRAEFQKGKFYIRTQISSLTSKSDVARHINRGRHLPLMREVFLCV